MNEDLKYPIGKYIAQPFSEKQLGEWLTDIKNLPQHLEHAVLNLDEAQLNTVYREGGWTLKQVVHHVADSHMNAFIRYKWTLTEEKPIIKAYFEDRWAELEDGRNTPVEVSLALIETLHKRWVLLMRSMKADDFTRVYIHPQYGKEFTLQHVAGLYAWHGKHHTAHITALKERMKW